MVSADASAVRTAIGPQPAEAALRNIRHMALCLNVLAAQDGPRKSDAFTASLMG